MSSSTGSGGVVGERAWWSAESVVEGDCCGEGEEAAADAGAEAVEGAGAVAFEGEQVFAGLEDRFDSLADWRQVRPAGLFVSTARPDDRRREGLGGAFEVAAGVALVGDDGEVAVSFAALEQRQADVAFGGFRGGERERAWGAVECEQPVQAAPPVV